VNFLFRKQRPTVEQTTFAAPNEPKSTSSLDKFANQAVLETAEMLELKGGVKHTFEPIFHFQQGCGGLSPQ
jgi:hypothetical protein